MSASIPSLLPSLPRKKQSGPKSIVEKKERLSRVTVTYRTYCTEMIDGTSAMESDNGTLYVVALFEPLETRCWRFIFLPQNGTYRE